MLQFLCRFAFLSTFRLSNRTPKVRQTWTLYQANVPNLMRCNFKKNNIHNIVLFGTHNLQTYLNIIHSSINYSYCSFTNLIFVRNCITESDENHASHCSELSQLHQQPVDAVLRSTFIRKLCYKLLSVVTFTFMHTCDQNFVLFTERRHVDRQCDA